MKKIYLLTVLLFVTTFSIFSQIFEKQGAGVTILVHGWNPDDSQPAWMQVMADSIIARNGGVGHIATITVTGTEGNLSTSLSDWTFSLATQNHAEIIVLVNWTAVANHLTTGIAAQEVAAAVAPLIYNGQNSEIPLASLPIHLIGHSRGGGMVFEIARLLGLQGVEVEHVTALNPHPLTAADPQGANPPLGPGQTIDASINVYENILFADCYYQNISAPTGQYINGAYNRLWTSLPGGYHNESGYTYNILGTNYDFSDHLNIILMYHGTIDLATPTSNGEATMNTTERGWFNTYENAGENTGYKYSRQIMGNRKSTDVPNSGDAIIAGFHNNALLGGTGARTAIDWTNAVWPNILTVEATLNGNALTQASTTTFYKGEAIQLNTMFRTNANTATIKALIDSDRNPYNNTQTLFSEVNVGTTGSTITSQSLNFNLSGDFTTGAKYYLLTEIATETEQRYLYAPYELEYGGSIDVSVTGIAKPVKDFGNTVVKASVYNNGDAVISDDFDITYICNGDTVTETFTPDINVDATVEYTFTQTLNISLEDIHTLKVFVDLQHDNNATNDTLSTQINTHVNGNTLVFDGVNDYVYIPNESNFDLNTTPFTIEAWFKVTTDHQSNVISKHTNESIYGGRSGYCIEYNTNEIKAIIGTGSAWTIISAPINLNQAYHVAMTYNSGTLKMYLNGQLIGTQTGTMLPNDRLLRIGSSNAYGNYFGGNIDEVRFWNSERTQQQIQDNMNTEIDPTSANLVAYYNFNRGISGGDNTLIDAVADMTVNNFHGTLYNFALTNGNSTSNFVGDCSMDFAAPETPTLPDLTGECSVIASAPTTTDNCAGSVTGTTTDPTEYTAQGTYTITWTFADGNGNSTTAQQTVIVDDVTAPVTPTLANLTGECSVTATAPTTTDNCAGSVTGTTTDPTEYTAQGTYTINWTFADGNGNSTTAQQTVIIDDETAPFPNVATLANITAECEVTTLTAPTATDNCAGLITGTHNATLPITVSTQIIWTYDDGNGNTSIQTQNIVIDDVTNPTITCVANQTVTADASHSYTVLGIEFDPTATDDNCGVANVENDFNNTSTLANAQLPEGTTTITWTVTDNDGNTATCSFNVLVNTYVGIADLSENGTLIYPNPTDDFLIIKHTEKPRISNYIELIDLTGKTIFEATMNEDILKIDLENFNKGIYILKISSESDFWTQIIIKN